MAEQNQQNDPKSHNKKPSKFGMMMSSMGRSAKQGMSRAGKQMAKGALKAKQTAVEKIAKVPITQEDPEIVSALERLKITKNEIYAISDIVRNLYEARVNEATFLIQLAEKLSSVKISQNDPFSSYVQKMGVGLSTLEQVQSEHLKRMEEELVVPLEKFRDIDVENCQKLKLKYKNGKTQYDIAAHRVTKAQESQDQQKIQNAQQKKDAVYTQLTQLRNDMKFQVNNLEQKKQVNLLGCMEQYWSSYSAFASAQSNILSKNTIQKESYIAPISQAQMGYNDNMNGVGNNNNNNDEMKEDDMLNMNNNDNNNNNETPPAPDMNANGAMPPPPSYGDVTGDNNQYDDNYDDNGEYQEDEYAEEMETGPTDDYNPFGDQ